MLVTFTEGYFFHRTHHLYENVQYIRIKGDELILRIDDKDLRFDTTKIDDFNVYTE